jgi:hypothetical protein
MYNDGDLCVATGGAGRRRRGRLAGLAPAVLLSLPESTSMQLIDYLPQLEPKWQHFV